MRICTRSYRVFYRAWPMNVGPTPLVSSYYTFWRLLSSRPLVYLPSSTVQTPRNAVYDPTVAQRRAERPGTWHWSSERNILYIVTLCHITTRTRRVFMQWDNELVTRHNALICESCLSWRHGLHPSWGPVTSGFVWKTRIEFTWTFIRYLLLHF
jgi:hypothetical protein